MNTFEPTPEEQAILDQYMFHSTHCPCGTSVYTTWCVSYGECSPAFQYAREEIIDMHNSEDADLSTSWGYPDDSVMYHFATTEHEHSPHCCNCGAKLNDDGTCGPTYEELERKAHLYDIIMCEDTIEANTGYRYPLCISCENSSNTYHEYDICEFCYLADKFEESPDV